MSHLLDTGIKGVHENLCFATTTALRGRRSSCSHALMETSGPVCVCPRIPGHCRGDVVECCIRGSGYGTAEGADHSPCLKRKSEIFFEHTAMTPVAMHSTL